MIKWQVNNGWKKILKEAISCSTRYCFGMSEGIAENLEKVNKAVIWTRYPPPQIWSRSTNHLTSTPCPYCLAFLLFFIGAVNVERGQKYINCAHIAWLIIDQAYKAAKQETKWLSKMGRKDSEFRVGRNDGSVEQSMSLPTLKLQPRKIIWQI